MRANAIGWSVTQRQMRVGMASFLLNGWVLSVGKSRYGQIPIHYRRIDEENLFLLCKQMKEKQKTHPPKWVRFLLWLSATGRSSGTWTHGLLVPNQARYQTALYPGIVQIPISKDWDLFGCPTRIWTQTNRVRVCRATLTQSGNVVMSCWQRILLYSVFGICQ